MKHLRKLLTLVVALVMTLGLVAPVFADETSTHTITIENTDQNVSHTYEGYQIFKGKLDATQKKLSDIVWGNGVDPDKFLKALVDANAETGNALNGKFPTLTMGKEAEGETPAVPKSTAADVAEAIATVGKTAANADAIAKIIGETDGVLTANKISFTEDKNNKKYTANVVGDGYYFIKDVTTKLDDDKKNSDTLSKYLLEVVHDIKVQAKDTHLNPDKNIKTETAKVKEGTAAVGDVVTFEVTIPVPDTTQYVDHFVFVMNDKLPAGMTFMGVTSVKVGTVDVPNTVTVAPKDSTTYGTYTAPDTAADAAVTAGGQNIKIVFNGFKAFAEADRDANTEGVQNLIGQDIVITYTAVVNKDAKFDSTGNKNEVVFNYSTDPNHDYDGDEPKGDEPVGTTPKSETTTFLTNIEILKTDDKKAALAGAEFEITSDDYNITLVTGEKFVASDYQAAEGETIQAGTYYKLKDGSYTTTAPTTDPDTSSSYDSTTTTYKKVTFSQSVTTPGTTKKVTVVSGEDGIIKLEGLKPGTYTIKETHAPTGFNLDKTEYTIVLEWNKDAKKIELDTTKSSEGVTFDNNEATGKLTIVNKSGTELPSTGGMGTTLFYVVGTMLVLGAGIVLVSKRRISE